MTKKVVRKYDARACAQQMIAAANLNGADLRLTDMLNHFTLRILLVNRSSTELGGHNARIDMEAEPPTIYLRRGLNKKEETQALAHELGHMYLRCNGIELGSEEKFCDVFANELVRLMGADRYWSQPTLPRL